MSDFLQEVEAEYMRIRGRRGLLKPLDWDLAAKWESAGCPLPVVLRTMAEIGDRFNRENPDDQINSLRYFDPAVRRAAAAFQAGQVGKSEPAGAPESQLSDMLVIDVKKQLESLEKAVTDLAFRQTKLTREILEVAWEINQLRESEIIDDRSVESRLQELDRQLIATLRSTVSIEINETFDEAGFSSDLYLQASQISAAVRSYFQVPEITLFLEF